MLDAQTFFPLIRRADRVVISGILGNARKVLLRRGDSRDSSKSMRGGILGRGIRSRTRCAGDLACRKTTRHASGEFMPCGWACHSESLRSMRKHYSTLLVAGLPGGTIPFHLGEGGSVSLRRRSPRPAHSPCPPQKPGPGRRLPMLHRSRRSGWMSGTILGTASSETGPPAQHRRCQTADRRRPYGFTDER